MKLTKYMLHQGVVKTVDNIDISKDLHIQLEKNQV